MTRRHLAASSILVALSLAACSTGGATTTPSAATVTVTNCGEKVEITAPAQRIFANDGPLIALLLALKAHDQVAAVSSLQRDAPTLRTHYGAEAVDGLKVVAKESPTLETVLANSPDVMAAGWNYGFSEEKNLTPDLLQDKGIDSYLLTESCRQADGARRGVVDPWTALRTDLSNLGKVTGREGEARKVIADLDRRLRTLRSAPQPAKPPTVFVFDSGDKDVFSSGRFGAPHAIIDAAGGRNALSDLKDTWTSVSWERLARSEPDAFVFVDYPPQTYAQKIEALQANPATKDLPAVKQKRFLNLSYVMWTSSPLNVDAAERVRTALERWRLVPKAS